MGCIARLYFRGGLVANEVGALEGTTSLLAEFCLGALEGTTSTSVL